MTSRYLGLVVVPGEYITKIEVEEFVSQLKGRIGVEGERLQGTHGAAGPEREEGMIPRGII